MVFANLRATQCTILTHGMLTKAKLLSQFKNKYKNLSVVVIGWDEVFSIDRAQKIFKCRIIFCMTIK